MELLNLYLHAELRYNRFILYTLICKVSEDFYATNPEVRATLFKITMNIPKKIDTATVPEK